MTGHDPHGLWNVQRVGLCGKPKKPQSGSGTQRAFFKRGTEVLSAGTLHAQRPSQQRGRNENAIWSHSVHHGLIKGVQSEVAYQLQLGADSQSGEYRSHSALKAWAGNWAPVIIVAQPKPPSLRNHKKGKNRAHPSLPTGTRKIYKTRWAVGFFFLSRVRQ